MSTHCIVEVVVVIVLIVLLGVRFHWPHPPNVLLLEEEMLVPAASKKPADVALAAETGFVIRSPIRGREEYLWSKFHLIMGQLEKFAVNQRWDNERLWPSAKCSRNEPPSDCLLPLRWTFLGSDQRTVTPAPSLCLHLIIGCLQVRVPWYCGSIVETMRKYANVYKQCYCLPVNWSHRCLNEGKFRKKSKAEKPSGIFIKCYQLYHVALGVSHFTIDHVR